MIKIVSESYDHTKTQNTVKLYAHISHVFSHAGRGARGRKEALSAGPQAKEDTIFLVN